MKIPEEFQVRGVYLIRDWQVVADRIALEHGIYVHLGTEFANNELVVSRLFFVVNGHEFESLKELRSALRNKAFL